jgi:hypothetical protein
MRASGTGATAWGKTPSRFASRLRGWLTACWQRGAPGRALPAELRTQLAFGPGERALIVGRDPAGDYALVATGQALHHRTGRDNWSRLGWEQITGVDWETSPGQLVVTGLAGAAPPRTVLLLRHHGALLELAKERITHTRLTCQQVMLNGHGRVIIEVRRRPVTGELLWAFVSDSKLDPGDLALRDQIERAARRVHADLGITPHRITYPPLTRMALPPG